MNHLDHIRTADYNSLTDFEKEALFKLIEGEFGTPVKDATSQLEYIFLTVYGKKPVVWSTIATNGHPLLSLKQLREYVAMGMLL